MKKNYPEKEKNEVIIKKNNRIQEPKNDIINNILAYSFAYSVLKSIQLGYIELINN